MFLLCCPLGINHLKLLGKSKENIYPFYVQDASALNKFCHPEKAYWMVFCQSGILQCILGVSIDGALVSNFVALRCPADDFSSWFVVYELNKTRRKMSTLFKPKYILKIIFCSEVGIKSFKNYLLFRSRQHSFNVTCKTVLSSLGNL